MRALAGEADPLVVITDRVRGLLLAAVDAGMTGPPVDPFVLAEMMGVTTQARADVADARIGHGSRRQAELVGPLSSFVPAAEPLVLEYNPTRPRGRLRYSVAHELAHALFPDVADVVRHRTGTGAVPQVGGDDGWQLELLCNIAAAELLMPTDAVAGLLDIDPDIDFIMATRARFDVSTEALLRRLAQATPRPLAVVAAGRMGGHNGTSLRVEYVVSSRNWSPPLDRGARLDPASPFSEPAAVGQTARGTMVVNGTELQVQTVGIPPYPGSFIPRVLGLAEPLSAPRTAPPGIEYVRGDLADVGKSTDPVVIAHVVSDAAHAWSRRGVARALAGRFPAAAAAYQSWTVADRGNLALGNVHSVDVGSGIPLIVASIVAQRGYGPSAQARLMYTALGAGLARVADIARQQGASVHLPRIGAGEAGGRWDLIEETIDRTLVRAGIPVTVHTKPQIGAGQ